MESNYELTENLRLRAQQHFVLLQAENIKKKRDSVSFNLSGYSDVGYLMSDIVKVCVLALSATDRHERIPEPETNVCGVLAVLLDLIPFEEFEFLDRVRQEVLDPVEDWDFIYERILVTPGWAGEIK